MKKLIPYFLGICLCLITLNSLAATPSPVVQVQMVTEKVLSELSANQASLKKNPEIVYSIIRKYLLPSVDTEMMSKSVLGRAGWAKATPEQQKEFVKQFTILMTYTYSTALAKYEGQEVKFFPVRGSYEGKTMVVVNGQVLQKDGPPVNMVYNLILHGNQWQVYDISVEGISLLQSFREQFIEILNSDGMDGLLKTLVTHNEQIAASNKKL